MKRKFAPDCRRFAPVRIRFSQPRVCGQAMGWVVKVVLRHPASACFGLGGWLWRRLFAGRSPSAARHPCRSLPPLAPPVRGGPGPGVRFRALLRCFRRSPRGPRFGGVGVPVRSGHPGLRSPRVGWAVAGSSARQTGGVAVATGRGPEDAYPPSPALQGSGVEPSPKCQRGVVLVLSVSPGR